MSGYILDLAIGDPHILYHPVRAIGSLIKITEKILCRLTKGRGKKAEFLAGCGVVFIVTTVSTAVPFFLLKWAYGMDVKLGFVLESLFCFQLLAAKGLYIESWKVGMALLKGDTENARKAVSMIVGRDTERLDEAGIARAAVETVAENTSDGVIAPLLFMAVFGAAGGFFYKAVNTMDSMMGYKNEKYLYLGRAAARLDDLCNYLPARITAGLLILSAFLLGYDGKQAFGIYCRDRYQHASPNSAHGEAAVAGALGIRLAGPAWYFGVLHKKPFIGDPGRDVEPEDIRRAGKMMFTAEALAVAVILAGLLLGW